MREKVESLLISEKKGRKKALALLSGAETTNKKNNTRK